MGLIDKQAASNAVRALKEINIDISNHLSSGISDEMVEWADHILVMELRHAIKLRERHDNLGTKVLQLGSFGGLVEVKDPVGGWRWKFRRSREDIKLCVEAFMDNLPPRLE
jgi:protein-tyrosine-phosphatase